MTNGTLRVFNSEGQQIHPVDADTTMPRYSNYFGTVHFQAGFESGHSHLESYVRVQTERRKEQVYIRYDGARPETVFEDCRTAVQAELVDGRGWQFPDQTQVDPSKLFLSLVWDADAVSGPSVAGTPLAEHERTLESILEAGEDQVRIHGRNFGILAGLVTKYSDLECSIAVVDRPELSASADLMLATADIVERIDVPEETLAVIDRHERQLARQRRQQQFGQLEAGIEDLARENIDSATFAQELQTRVSPHFPDVRVQRSRTAHRGPTDPAGQRDVRTDGRSEILWDEGATDTDAAATHRSVWTFSPPGLDRELDRRHLIGGAVVLTALSAVLLGTQLTGIVDVAGLFQSVIEQFGDLIGGFLRWPFRVLAGGTSEITGWAVLAGCLYGSSARHLRESAPGGWVR